VLPTTESDSDSPAGSLGSRTQLLRFSVNAVFRKVMSFTVPAICRPDVCRLTGTTAVPPARPEPTPMLMKAVVGVGVHEAVGVGVGVFVGVDVGVGVGVEVGVLLGVKVGVLVAVSVGVGV